MTFEEPEGKIDRRGTLFRAIFLIGLLLLAAQMWRLQIIEGSSLRERADHNRTRTSMITPPRGIIYDRYGRILASNSPVFTAAVVPADIPQGRTGEILSRLAGLLDIPMAQVQKAIDRRRTTNDPFTPIPVWTGVDLVAVHRVEEHHLDLPGVLVLVESARRYSDGQLLSHILGYMLPISPDILPPGEYERKLKFEQYTINDKIGAAGLERTYESRLRGRPGRRLYEVDVSGRTVSELRVEPAEPGSNLVLSIDMDLQRYVASVLSQVLDRSPSAAAVVMDPNNGDVLAMVNFPTYDNNVYSDPDREEELTHILTDPRQPLFPRAVAGQYPPGSTFKLVTGAGALQEGLASRDTIIESKGSICVPNEFNPHWCQPFPDWAAHGKMNFIQGLAFSSNVYFFYLGGGYEPEGFEGLGRERLAYYARSFGYGAPTGIDLPGEAAGLIPDEEWKRRQIGEVWVKGDTYNMAIGQGFVQATPLQVANATNAIANGGTLYSPRLVRQIVDSDGHILEEMPTRVIRKVPVEPRHLALIREGMEAGFTISPLLKDFKVPGLRVAAKTGTGEFFGERNERGELPTHGWFTGFAPADAPQISVTVFVERGSGSKEAAPIAMRIIRHYFGLEP